MMKRLFYFLVMFSSVLWSCFVDNVDGPDNVKEVYLEVNLSDLVFEAQGGEKSFWVMCSALDHRGDSVEYGWTITGGDEWCRTDVTEGSGWMNVTVTVDAYTGDEDRNTNLTIKAGDKSFVLTVTQKHGDAIVLSKDKFDVPVGGGEVTVEVKSNIQYEVFIPYQFQRWIKQTPVSKALMGKNFTFTILENENYEKRDGYIVFKGNSLRDTVYIYQAQKDGLVLTQNIYNLQCTGGEIVVELKTNIDYDVAILDNAASWISRTETKALREDRLNFRIAANTGMNERIARIVIKDKNSALSDTVYIKQASKGMYGGDLVWETEQDLINFQTAGHTKVVGNIIVQGKEIRTLQKLNNVLTEIDGSIIFDCSTLSSFDGLYALKKISGDLIFQQGRMTSCEGLQNLAEISGNFKVISSSLSFLTSFSGLRGLKKIGGDFELSATSSLNNLSSFEGLESLEEIDGNFKVIASSYYSHSLSSLKSFRGLSGLKKISGDFELSVTSSAGSSFSAGSSVSSFSLNNLSSFEGLESLEEIGGNFKVIASASYYSRSLSSLKSFRGLSGLKRIGGDFELCAALALDNLFSFEGLESLEEIGRNFKIIASAFSSAFTLSFLESFRGLSGLKKIGGDFELSATSDSSSDYPASSISFFRLSSFEGLESLEEIGGNFKVIASSFGYSFSLPDLISFRGLSGLKRIGGDFELSATSSSDYSGDCFSSLGTLSSFEGLESLEEIGGHFKVIASSLKSSSLSSLTSFGGLSSLKRIGGDFELSATSSSNYPGDCFSSLGTLSSFEGLESLEEIGGHFRVIASSSSESSSLSSLTSFGGLSSLKRIGGDFELNATSSLDELSSFEGLESLSEIGGNFKVIASSSLNNLSSFEGLENLGIVGKELTITDCSVLNNIDALSKVGVLDEISITGCSKLYDFCILKSVVQNMNGTFYVNENGYNPTKYQLLNGECSKTSGE